MPLAEWPRGAERNRTAVRGFAGLCLATRPRRRGAHRSPALGRIGPVIVSLHVATGGVLGALARTRPQAVLLGLVSHAAGDRMRHHDIASKRYELVSGTAALLAVCARRGVFDPATLGAVAASAPDLEHVVRLPRPRGRKLFPSHRIPGFHRSGGVSAEAQLLAAGILLGALLGWRPEQPRF